MPDSPADSERFPQAFLPNLCSLQAVFLLVLLGELLAVALTLADTGLAGFQWERLGMLSFLIQWVFLASAAALCPLRNWLGQIPAWQAGALCYLLVLLVTLVCSAVGLWMVKPEQPVVGSSLLTSLLISAIIAGIALRYLYLQQQLSNQKEAELQARIAALQSRIRPHFLFNSMNSIASLIEVDPERAEKMVVDLSSLFRASLAEPGLVPLADELALCRRYIAIEQTRLGDRLQLSWNDGVDISDVSIPSLMLQPIIENAIYHGIQPLPEGGIISVALTREEKWLQIQVTNPSTNPCVEPADNSASAVQSPGDAEAVLGQSNRVALANIRHRLQAYYGSQYGGSKHEGSRNNSGYGREASLTLEQRDGLYITTLRIPIK